MTSTTPSLLRSTTLGVFHHLLVAYSLVTIGLGLWFINFSVDDAFITFRYGKSLAEAGIWNWNPENFQRVEAYTNPLFAALSIPVHFLHLPPMLIFKLLALLLLYKIWQVLSEGAHTSTLKWLALAFMSSNVFLFPHAFSGLETIAFLVMALVVMSRSADQLGSPACAWLVLIAPLIRPEGAVISLYILGVQSHRGLVNRHTWLAVALGILYFVIRYEYFGKLLPNTFYVKMGEGEFNFLHNLIGERHVILLGLTSLAVIKLSGGQLLLPAMLFGAYALGNLPSDMQMNYGHRFAYHLLYPSVFYAASLLIKRLGLTPKQDVKNIQLLGIQMAALFGFALAAVEPQQVQYLAKYYPAAIRSHKALGLALAPFKKDAVVLAIGDAGLVPYYSNLTTIDFIGLANSEMGTYISKGTPPTLRTADVMVVYAKKAGDCSVQAREFKGERWLRQNMLTREPYVCVAGPNWGGEFYLNALVRQAHPKATELIAAIEQVGKASPDAGARALLREALMFKGLREDLRH